ncbi:MAG: (2Fe-2S)-binding protein [Chloroflexi bacterium]|nr:(2Fe-2S)-binding protein [Chloroflexota bacterium]
MKAVRISTVQRGRAFTIEVDGQKTAAYEGETIATILLTAGVGNFHAPLQAHLSSSRLFCGMGACRQCLVTVNGRPSHRACQTIAQPGMKVETGV